MNGESTILREAFGSPSLHANLALAWLWIVLGFIVGLVLGLNFHREDWLGGYGSFQRRLCRLGHISFFGLGIVNLMFYFTVRSLGLAGTSIEVASCAFVVGAVSMPACCFTMVFFPKLRLLFAVPVLSLIAAGLATFLNIVQL